MRSGARVPFLVLVVLLLSSCVPAIQHPRVTRELVVSQSPDIAYARALQAATAVGGIIVHTDTTGHLIQARVQNAATLVVVIRPQGAGSVIEATHHVDANQIAYGEVKLAQDFLDAYSSQR